MTFIGHKKVHATVLLAILAMSGCQTVPATSASKATMALGANRGGAYALLDKGKNKGGHDSDRDQARDSVVTPSNAQACAPNPYVIFTHNTTDDFHCSGSRNSFQGDCHTNAGYEFSGSNNQISGYGEHHRSNTNRGHANSCGDDRTSDPVPYPGQLCTMASLGTPTFQFNGDVDLKSVAGVWADKNTLKPGIYRCTGTLSISGSKVSGNVTLIAEKIHISGSQCNLKAYSAGVLCYATSQGGNGCQFSGSNGTYAGICYAYESDCRVDGHSNDFTGQILCDRFHCSGSQNTFCRDQHEDCTPAPSPSASPVAETPPPTPSPVPTTPPPDPTPSPDPSPTPVAGDPTPSPTPSPTETTVPPDVPPGSTTTFAGPPGCGPYALALDARQNLWYTTSGGFQDEGVEMSPMGATMGTVLEGFDCRSVAIDPVTQRAWISSYNLGTVRVFNNDDRTQAFEGGPGGGIHLDGIAFDPVTDTPWVCDFDDGWLYRLDSANGAVRATIKSGGNLRSILFVNNQMWVTDNNPTPATSRRIKIFTTSGTPLSSVALPDQPSYMTTDRDGNIWVTLTGPNLPLAQGVPGGTQVAKISPAGQVLGTFNCGGVSPFGIATDKDGNILVANASSDSLTKLSTSGQVLASYPTGHQPLQVVVDQSGYAWVTCHNQSEIDRIFP